MASERSEQRPGQDQPRQRTTSILRPSTTFSDAREVPYSFAGPRDTLPRQPARHATHVEEGYRELNPDYEREVNDPVFSLGGNLPHTVRGFMKRHGGHSSKSKRVGVEREEKGARERAPQVQNTDERATRTCEQANRNNTDDAFGQKAPISPSGDVGMRTLQAQDSQGRNLNTIGEEATILPKSGDQSDDEKTLAADASAEPPPFNPWAGFRRKYQDPLGEWLGVRRFGGPVVIEFANQWQTTVLMAIGVSSNLQMVTSQQEAGNYTTMCFGWGFATMISV